MSTRCQFVVRSFDAQFLVHCALIPNRYMITIGIVVLVGYVLHNTKILTVFRYKFTRQTFCRSCKARVVQVVFLRVPLGNAVDFTNDFQTKFLGFFRFTVVVSGQHDEGFCQTDESDTKRAVFQHRFQRIVLFELFATLPHLTHQQRELVLVCGALTQITVTQLVGNKVGVFVQVLEETVHCHIW